jgi:hypothetical protein
MHTVVATLRVYCCILSLAIQYVGASEAFPSILELIEHITLGAVMS